MYISTKETHHTKPDRSTINIIHVYKVENLKPVCVQGCIGTSTCFKAAKLLYFLHTGTQ